MTEATPLDAPTLWMPQPGPQERAINTGGWVDEVLFGGARGGGKTSFTLGDYVQDIAHGPSWQGILFRRSIPELDEVIHQSKQIYPAYGGQWKAGVKDWRFPSGAVLRLRHMEDLNDYTKYHGHCVAEDTPVLMANGTYKPIQDVWEGDRVQTVEGPRRVMATHDLGLKPCVDVFSGATWLQSHPADHRLLTSSSWQSYASLRDNAATSPSPTSPESAPTASECLPLAPPTDPYYVPSAIQDFLDATTADSLADYPPGLYFHGAPLRFHSGSDPKGAPSPVYAEAPCLALYTPDGRGNILSHTHQDGLSAYVHPYTASPRRGRFHESSVALEMTPCGEKKVYDLTVQEVNHYITTRQGLINCNSYGWIGWDDLGQWPDLTPYKAMISTLRGAAPRKRIRSSANPGGLGHLELKRYFQIGRFPAGLVRMTDPRSLMSRMYIPAKVTDNKILLKDDPMYVRRLYASGDEALIKAWVDGDWDSIVGTYFGMWNPTDHIVEPYPIDPAWPVYMGLDYGETNPTAAVLAAVDFDGTVIIFGEYSVANRGAADHARDLMTAIKSNPWANGRMPAMALADPSMWTKRHTGEAHLTRSPQETFLSAGHHLTRANNDRVNGWRVLMDAMRHNRIVFFSDTTRSVTEAIPTMQRDPNNQEDMLKGGNDHGVDALRYLMVHAYQPTPIEDVRTGPFQGDRMLKMLQKYRLGRR